MRILVTGVSGFVGSQLAPKLLAEGHRVRALARDPTRVYDLAKATRSHNLVEAPPDDPTRSHNPTGAPPDDPAEATRSFHPAETPNDPPTRAAHLPTAAYDQPTRSAGIDVIRGDALTGEGLARALDGIEVAYYLIHSMESRPPGNASDSTFQERERLGATNFAAQARRAGVTRIVYFGGLLPRGDTPVSRHLASRGEVESILFEYVPNSVALRSAIVIGARSRSFRLLVRLLERLPALPLPPWSRFRTQPIDARDATEMLAAAAHVPAVAGRSLDIGGPETLTYQELLERTAELLLLRRPTLRLRAAMTPLAGRLAAALAGEDPALTVALMEGLQSDLLPAPDHAAELLGVQLHSFDAAVERALREWEATEPLAAR